MRTKDFVREELGARRWGDRADEYELRRDAGVLGGTPGLGSVLGRGGGRVLIRRRENLTVPLLIGAATLAAIGVGLARRRHDFVREDLGTDWVDRGGDVGARRGAGILGRALRERAAAGPIWLRMSDRRWASAPLMIGAAVLGAIGNRWLGRRPGVLWRRGLADELRSRGREALRRRGGRYW
jgi:hypothetical protein